GLAQSAHLLGASAQRADLDRRRRLGGGRLGDGLGGHLLLDDGLDVLLADASAHAGAGDLVEVHVVVGRELADQRRDVRGRRLLGRRRGGGRSLGRGGGLRLLGLRRGRGRCGGRLGLGGGRG